MTSRRALYAGTFDPVTVGHMAIISRALKIFDHLVIAIGKNAGKAPIFTLEERLDLLKKSLIDRFDHIPDTITITHFNGLAAKCAIENHCQTMVRGLRSHTDFEYESRMAMVNRQLAPDVETILLPCWSQHYAVASSTVKELAKLGAECADYVTPSVATFLKNFYFKK